MFTGIISHLGAFTSYAMSKRELTLYAPRDLADELEPGGSLAVDGVCLSLVRKKGEALTFNLSPETLKQTTLGNLKHGSLLNLERPLTLSTPLDGHLVSGHIDARERLQKMERRGEGRRLAFTLSPGLRTHFIAKGSVAVNGISLTVADLSANEFETEIIPLTFKTTNLCRLRVGSEVNIESDILGKYMYNWLLKDTLTSGTKDPYGKKI